MQASRKITRKKLHELYIDKVLNLIAWKPVMERPLSKQTVDNVPTPLDLTEEKLRCISVTDNNWRIRLLSYQINVIG